MVQFIKMFENTCTTVELQWLEHGWLVYLGCYELVLGVPWNKSHSCRFGII